MKKRCVFAMWVLLCILLLPAAVCNAMDIVRDGQAAAVIVIPDEPLPVVSFAAEELQYHIEKASGAQLAVATESATPAEGPRIFLGPCRATAEAGIVLEGLEPNTWILSLQGDRFFMAGDDSDGPAAWVLHGNRTRVGTMFAVYEFLERHLGVRWLWPGPLGEVIPAAPTIAVEQWEERGKPFLIHSRLRDGGNIVAGADGWASQEARSRFLAEQGKWQRRQRIAMGVNMDMAHAFTTWWDQYHETHPEHFNLLPDGTRRSDPFYHGAAPSLISMCVSNRDFQEKVVERWLGRRTPDKPHVDISENDTAGKCTCDDCMALDVPDPELDGPWETRLQRAREAFARGEGPWYTHLGSLSDRYARFYLDIQALAHEHDPEAVVMGYAYANYVNPPLQTMLNDKVVIGVVPPMYFPWTDTKREYNRNQWEGWSDTGARMFLRPNWMLDGHNLPMNVARKLGEDFRFYAQNGLIGTDFDSLTGQYSAQGPNLYMLTRLHNRPEMEVEEVLDEYFAAFGPAQQQVRAYFDHWEQVCNAVEQETIIGLHFSYFYREAHQFFTPQAMAEGRRLIDAAMQAAAGDATAHARVDYLEKGFRQAELTLAAQKAYVDYRDNGQLAPLREAITTLDAHRAAVEEDLVSNVGFAYWAETRTWDRRLIQLMDQPGEQLPDPWKFAWDTAEIGEAEGWFADELDTADWLDIGTHGQWELQEVGRQWREEHGEDYNGLAWYRTSFELDRDAERTHVMLAFGAVDEACRIWVNGVQVLDRPYPYQGNTESWREPFEVDVSEVVRYDRPNTLAVLVINRAGLGGIWRPVWLRQSAPVADAALNLIRDGSFALEDGSWRKSVMTGTFDLSIDRTQSRSGEASGRIECLELGPEEDEERLRTRAWARFYQTDLTVDPNRTYRLRAWVRTTDDFVGDIGIWVTGTDEGTVALRALNTEGLWRELVREGIRPAGDKLAVYLNMRNGTGVVWFDDVELLVERND